MRFHEAVFKAGETLDGIHGKAGHQRRLTDSTEKVGDLHALQTVASYVYKFSWGYVEVAHASACNTIHLTQVEH